MELDELKRIRDIKLREKEDMEGYTLRAILDALIEIRIWIAEHDRQKEGKRGITDQELMEILREKRSEIKDIEEE